MVEALVLASPLPGLPVAHDGVTMAAAPMLARFSLRARVAEGMPAKVLSTAPYAGGSALCLGPDEWLLLLPDGSPAPGIVGIHALTDIGHRNVGIALAGPNAAKLLQTGCALELTSAAFPVGKATRTLYETVEIVLWRLSQDQFHIEVWRSFASYLWSALDLAAGDMMMPGQVHHAVG